MIAKFVGIVLIACFAVLFGSQYVPALLPLVNIAGVIICVFIVLFTIAMIWEHKTIVDDLSGKK
jgi:hypothetical protein